MAILAFQKPDKVLMLEADDKYGKFEFRPLEPGFGITVGNAFCAESSFLPSKAMPSTRCALPVWSMNLHLSRGSRKM